MRMLRWLLVLAAVAVVAPEGRAQFRLGPGPDGGAEAAIWLSAARDDRGVVA